MPMFAAAVVATPTTGIARRASVPPISFAACVATALAACLLTDAAPMFERALALDPNLAAARNNLELAHALTGRYDEARRPGERARDWARRLNNQGYAALLVGDREGARRLLSQAITASPSRFEEAERNLARANAE